uniref:EF-hand domain-containing protein n=1 Tax=Oryza glumipatula TaxID=40148 RepID=A0A0E0BNR3_9ORYZ
MMKLAHLFGSSSSSSSSKKENKVSSKKRRSGAKSCSFGSTTSSSSLAASSSDDSAATTPRSVLPTSAAASSSGTKKPAAAAVTREDLEVALRRIVSSKEELAAMLAEADYAGELVLEEIAAAAADEGEMKETFAVFDADGDGRISAEELRAVLASLGDELCSVDDCRRMIGGVDTDGDGFVCFDEFARMMMCGRA